MAYRQQDVGVCTCYTRKPLIMINCCGQLLTRRNLTVIESFVADTGSAWATVFIFCKIIQPLLTSHTSLLAFPVSQSQFTQHSLSPSSLFHSLCLEYTFLFSVKPTFGLFEESYPSLCICVILPNQYQFPHQNIRYTKVDFWVLGLLPLTSVITASSLFILKIFLQ